MIWEPAGSWLSSGSLTQHRVRCNVLRIRTTHFGSSTALPHMLSAALMQSVSVGSTIGMRLRRTPDGPAVKQLT